MVVGHVGKEPVERTVTAEAVKVCQFSLAVDEGKDKDPLWLTVVAWRKLAEQVKTYVHTGDLVLVEGKLSIRPYTDTANVKHTAVEVIATDIRFLHAKQEPARTNATQPAPAMAPAA